MIDTNKLIEFTRSIKLLYVEDNKEARDSTVMLLKYIFKDVIVAVDGQDGLEQFIKYYNQEKEEHIDIVITDLNMPNMDGITMIKEIRKIDNLIPTIVLSAHDENNYVIESIKRGVCSYLNKPIETEELLEAIYNAFNYTPVCNDIPYDDKMIASKYKQNINPNSIVTIFDPNGIVLYVNDTFAYMFGFPKDEIVGRPYYTLSKEKHDEELIDEIWQTIKIKKKIWSGTIRYVNNFDEVYFLRGTITPILDKNNNILEFVSIREDITNLVNQELEQYDIS